MKRIAILLFIFQIICCLSLYAEENDSIVKDLQEFVVESKSAWIEDDHVVFVPTRKERNRANSVETLLRSMNIPLVSIRDNEIKDLRGEQIVIYINGNEATEVELANFWPKNVIRVDYYSDPSDPKYKGNKAVINFIVAEYSVGGVTKFNTYQDFLPYTSRYKISSKLDYKDMTYAAMIYAHTLNQREQQSKSENQDIYKNVWYDDNFYSIISNKNVISDQSDIYGVRAVLNAIYNNKRNMRLSHSVAISWEDWKSKYYGENQWSPELFSQNNSWSGTSKMSLSPQLSGMYDFTLNHKFSLTTNWSYSYASIDRVSDNQISDLPTISNSSSEDVHVIGISNYLGYVLNQYHLFELLLSEDVNMYSITYSGSYDNVSRQTMSTTKVAVRWCWRPHNSVYINLMPGFTIEHRNIHNVETHTAINPYLNLSYYWYESQKAFISVYGGYAVDNAKASQANEILQQQSELMWYMGNSTLRNPRTFRVGLQQTWMPATYLTTNLNIAYIDWNAPYTKYFAAPQELGGLIKQTVNNSSERAWSFDLNLNSNLFNRTLTINLTPSLMLQRSGNHDYMRKMNRFAIRGDISYNIGNVSLMVSYSGVDKVIGDGGHLTQYRPDRWNVGVTYGNGDFYASLMVNDIFRRHTYQLTDIEFDYYINQSRNIQLGRNFSFNLSYIFGYGKRIGKHIDIQTIPEIQSGAVGSN